MKEKLVSALGTFGMILWYIISCLYAFAPLLYLDIPFLLGFALAFVIITFPVIGGIVSIVLYVWATIVALQSPFNIVTIIFLIFALLYFFTTLLPLIVSLFGKGKD